MDLDIDRRHFMTAAAAVVATPLLPAIPEAKPVCPNLRATIEQTNAELMKAFATAPANVHRGEIRRFYKVLDDITAFADELGKHLPAINNLSFYTSYWGLTWFEKEHHDSIFEPFETHASIQQKIGGDFEKNIAELEAWVARPKMQHFLARARAAQTAALG